MRRIHSGRFAALAVGLTAAAALVPAGTVAAAPAMTPGADTETAAARHTLGPTGYRSLRLGMSRAEALGTRLLTDPVEIGHCTWYHLRPSEGSQAAADGVVVSPDRGVVNIPGTSTSQTPRGVTRGPVGGGYGTPLSQVVAVYPRGRLASNGFVYTAPVPGNPAAHYTMALDQLGRVDDLALTSDDTGGCLTG